MLMERNFVMTIQRGIPITDDELVSESDRFEEFILADERSKHARGLCIGGNFIEQRLDASFTLEADNPLVMLQRAQCMEMIVKDFVDESNKATQDAALRFGGTRELQHA